MLRALAFVALVAMAAAQEDPPCVASCTADPTSCEDLKSMVGPTGCATTCTTKLVTEYCHQVGCGHPFCAALRAEARIPDPAPAAAAAPAAADDKLVAYLKTLKSWKGWSSAKEACTANGGSARGYAGGSAGYKIKCSNGNFEIKCLGSPFTCCTASNKPAHVCHNCADDKWSCPASWSTSGAGGTVPSETPDAKAFIAANNVYRCMHDVRPVQWDDEVYTSAKKWADYTKESMVHSHSGTAYRAGTDGENLAGTAPASFHRGVDATHMWYAEIADPCKGDASCYQSFTAGHFTAMMWKSMAKIAYSDTSKKLAVGRYRGCNNDAPNFGGQYKKMVPKPVKTWAACIAEVNKCQAFDGIEFGAEAHGANGVEGCDGHSVSDGKNPDGSWIWKKEYQKSCAAKYANILTDTARLYDIPGMPEFFTSGPGLCTLVSGLFLASVVVMLAVRRRRGVAREHELLVPELEGSVLEETGLE